MKKAKGKTEMTFEAVYPTEWTEEAQRQFDQGLKILARMIATDILKKRAAKASQMPEPHADSIPTAPQTLPATAPDKPNAVGKPKRRSWKNGL